MPLPRFRFFYIISFSIHLAVIFTLYCFSIKSHRAQKNAKIVIEMIDLKNTRQYKTSAESKKRANLKTGDSRSKDKLTGEKISDSEESDGGNTDYTGLENSALAKLNQSIHNSLVYPPVALEMGWEDEIRIRVYLAPGGIFEKMEYLQKSEYAVLNRSIEDAVRSFKYPKFRKKVIVPLGFHFIIKSKRW